MKTRFCNIVIQIIKIEKISVNLCNLWTNKEIGVIE
jgi:hypothetical protein